MALLALETTHLMDVLHYQKSLFLDQLDLFMKILSQEPQLLQLDQLEKIMDISMVGHEIFQIMLLVELIH